MNSKIFYILISVFSIILILIIIILVILFITNSHQSCNCKLNANNKIKKLCIGNKTALLIIDMQNDFVNPKGSLYVPGSEEIIPKIIRLILQYSWDLVICTQDWHPKNHISFEQRDIVHTGGNVNQNRLSNNRFPPHCVQNSWGAEIIECIRHAPYTYVIIEKGYDRNVDSFSAFEDNNQIYQTGLDQLLKSREICNLVIVGVAAEFCVYFTARSGVNRGYDVTVLKDAIGYMDPSRNILNQYIKDGIKINTTNWYLQPIDSKCVEQI